MAVKGGVQGVAGVRGGGGACEAASSFEDQPLEAGGF